MDPSDTCWLELRDAIIQQAVHDYYAIKIRRRRDRTEQAMMEQIERFFCNHDANGLIVDLDMSGKELWNLVKYGQTQRRRVSLNDGYKDKGGIDP